MLDSLILPFSWVTKIIDMRFFLITSMSFIDRHWPTDAHLCVSNHSYSFRIHHTVYRYEKTTLSPLLINRQCVPSFGHRLLNCPQYH